MEKINDRFYPTPLPKLLKIIISNLKHGHVLGLPQELFFRPQKDDFFKTQFFGHEVDSPIGVAAGPHTQLSQNIIIAWLAGARFIELKTIQTLDELDIPKPCIDMQDEGYNCEWSQELKIHQAFDQYLDAWIIIHILQHELGLERLGTIFNMSVGYDMKGIMQDNVQWFLNKMQDASQELQEKIDLIRPVYPKIDQINIPAQITDNITLSTMHGCPPDEVEQIAAYLIQQRRLNTIIKLNPTLLGQKEINIILKNSGFRTQVPDIAFEHDLKFDQAVSIVERMLQLAEENNVFFGIKLTNTLESRNNKKIFDADEMYMSGRALHPISINLARKFQNYFNGKLKISFSGGVDAFNITNVLKCGLAPVTVSSDLLKPGGYGRLAQYYQHLRQEQKNLRIKNIDDLINSTLQATHKDTNQNALENLNNYADLVLVSPYYQKQHIHDPSIKTSKKLEKFDCIFAPCQYTCPTNQDVPEYMYFTATEQYERAFQVILEDNPFPAVLGYSCDHTCQTTCTQMNYTESLHIREIKRFVAEYNWDKPFTLKVRKVNNTGKIAIIGGGPAGLSAAFYLTLYGYKVKIFEASSSLGGMIDKALPLFRLPAEVVKHDIGRILNQGIEVQYNTKISPDFLNQLETEYDGIIVAIGAQINPVLRVPGYDADGVLNALEFLMNARSGKKIQLGKRIGVIGGGNTAMDVARVAKRLAGPDAKVIILYRRTKQYMPAQEEEILDALSENIELLELVEPIKYIVENGKITGIVLQKMRLEDDPDSPRPKPVPTDEKITIDLDTIIPAIGQQVEEGLVKIARKKGYPVIGDADNGGLSIVRAVADGKLAAYNIIRQNNPNFHPWEQEKDFDIDYKTLKLKRYQRIPAEPVEITPPDSRHDFSLIVKSLDEYEAQQEASRCMLCDKLCDICTTVCPNMANQHYNVEPHIFNIQKIKIAQGRVEEITEDTPVTINQQYQTLNIADWCNECGNCTTFCPTSGRPYADKPRLHLSWQSYTQSPYGFFVQQEPNTVVYYKEHGQQYKLLFASDGYMFEAGNVKILLDQSLRVIEVVSTGSHEQAVISVRHAVEMLTIYHAYRQIITGENIS